MACKTIAPSRALLEAFRPMRKHSVCKCLRATPQQRGIIYAARRHASTTSTRLSEMEVEGESPRWSQTPPAMKAPYPTKQRPANWKPFPYNNDPQKLDRIYDSFLGEGGSSLLTDETKWLAATHKSFDQGRRGFNDRLAFFGRRIIELQLSLSLLNAADVSRYLKDYQDPHGREPFSHPATANVEVLAGNAKRHFMHHAQIARVAKEYDLPSTIRWQPRYPHDLMASGCDAVYTQTVFAIFGALAMERGSAVANRLVRSRLLLPLGVNDKSIEKMEALQ